MITTPSLPPRALKSPRDVKPRRWMWMLDVPSRLSAHRISRPPHWYHVRLQPQVLPITLARIILEPHQPARRRIFLLHPPPLPIRVAQYQLGFALPELFLNFLIELKVYSRPFAPLTERVHHRGHSVPDLSLGLGCRHQKQLQRVHAVPQMPSHRRLFGNPALKADVALKDFNTERRAMAPKRPARQRAPAPQQRPLLRSRRKSNASCKLRRQFVAPSFPARHRILRSPDHRGELPLCPPDDFSQLPNGLIPFRFHAWFTVLCHSFLVTDHGSPAPFFHHSSSALFRKLYHTTKIHLRPLPATTKCANCISTS